MNICVKCVVFKGSDLFTFFFRDGERRRQRLKMVNKCSLSTTTPHKRRRTNIKKDTLSSVFSTYSHAFPHFIDSQPYSGIPTARSPQHRRAPERTPNYSTSPPYSPMDDIACLFATHPSPSDRPYREERYHLTDNVQNCFRNQ